MPVVKLVSWAFIRENQPINMLRFKQKVILETGEVGGDGEKGK